VTGRELGTLACLRAAGAAGGLGRPLRCGVVVQVSDPGRGQFVVEGGVHRGEQCEDDAPVYPQTRPQLTAVGVLQRGERTSQGVGKFIRQADAFGSRHL